MITKEYLYIGAAVIIFILGGVLGGITQKHFNPPCDELVESVSFDTIVVRDTVRLPVPASVNKGVVKVETVKPIKKDVITEKGTQVPEEPKNVENDTPVITPGGEVEIPIERKEYATADYKAVVEGWRPNLLSMEVYPKTTTVTKTEVRLKKPVFSITVGPGVGYDGKEIKPNISVTAGLVIFSK